MEEFTITKQVAKHGKQSIIVLPSVLADILRPKTLVEVKIKVLRGVEK